jgi:peptidoglycan/xylan/chitin deacetylase (PgdA/CDA1 family)
MLIAINYHYIRESFDTPYPGIHGSTTQQLAAQLETLASVGEFVSMRQIQDAIEKRRPLPENAMIVTLDDGLREQYETALPVFQKLDVSAQFFINTRPIDEGLVSAVHQIHLLRANMAPDVFANQVREKALERRIEIDHDADEDKATAHYKYDTPEIQRLKYMLNFTLDRQQRDSIISEIFGEFFDHSEKTISEELYMTRDQIADLGRAELVGSHAHEHLPLGLLSLENQHRQLSRSTELLADWAGYRPYALSYPYGSRDAASRVASEVAQSHGIQFAFTMERAGNPNLDEPLHLARFDSNDVPGGKAALWEASEMFEAAPARDWFTKANA